MNNTTCLSIAIEVAKRLGHDTTAERPERRYAGPHETAVYRVGPVTAGISYFIEDDAFKVHARYRDRFVAVPLHEGVVKATSVPPAEFHDRYTAVLVAALEDLRNKA